MDTKFLSASDLQTWSKDLKRISADFWALHIKFGSRSIHNPQTCCRYLQICRSLPMQADVGHQWLTPIKKKKRNDDASTISAFVTMSQVTPFLPALYELQGVREKSSLTFHCGLECTRSPAQGLPTSRCLFSCTYLRCPNKISFYQP